MVFLALLATTALTDPLCAKALEVAPELHCAPAAYGVVLAPDAAHAATLASYTMDAEARFATHFDQPIITALQQAWSRYASSLT